MIQRRDITVSTMTSTNITERNTASIAALYGAFGQGDFPAVLSMLHPDIEWSNAGPDGVAYFGTRHGRSCVQEVFDIIATEFEIAEFAPMQIFAAGPHVAVWLHQQTTIRSTGRSFTEDLVHIWSFDEAGAIVRLRDIQDSWAIATALGH